MKSNKIISFQRDSEFYYKLAVNSAETGNHCSALEYLRRASKIEPDCLDYRLFMAELYFDMELFEYSNNEYFKVLRQEKSSECYFGLGQNYIYLDEYIYAINYFKKCLEFSDLDEDDLEYAEEIIARLNEETESMSERNYEPLINWARSLLKSGDSEYAAQLLKFVPEKSESYIEASNYLALSYHMVNKPEHAISKINEILETDPENIFALCTYISIANARGDIALRDSLVEKVLGLNCRDVSEYFKIATALCDIKDHKNAVKYLEKVLVLKPYDLTTLMLLSIGYYNTGNQSKAKIYLNRLIKIDEGNSIAKYYNTLVDSPRKNDTLDYNCQVPYSEAITRIKKIESALRLPVHKLNEMYENNSEFAELIKWSMTMQDSRLMNLVFNKIIFCPSFHTVAHELIASVFVNNYLKKLLIRNLCFQKSKKFVILVDAELKNINPVYPRELDSFPQIFLRAYSNVIATLCFMETGFERKLNKCFKDTLARLLPYKTALKSEEALSALLAKEYGMFEGNMESLCEVFDARIKTLKSYLKLIGAN